MDAFEGMPEAVLAPKARKGMKEFEKIAAVALSIARRLLDGKGDAILLKEFLPLIGDADTNNLRSCLGWGRGEGGSGAKLHKDGDRVSRVYDNVRRLFDLMTEEERVALVEEVGGKEAFVAKAAALPRVKS